MTAFTARGRAEEFDSLVEGTSTGRDDARYAEFLEIVESLRATPPPEARPEFVADLRERLMAAAATDLVPAVDEARLTLPPRSPRRERRIAVAVGGLAIVGATTSVAMAAQSALPGEALYPIKRAIENAQTGFSTDEAGKGSHLLANASGRLDEVSELSRQGDAADDAAIASTLNTFSDQAAAASDLLLDDYAQNGQERSIEELRSFTADSMATLTDLEDDVPVSARDELIHAARVLAQIDASAGQACPTCAGGIGELPDILFSGSTVDDSGADPAASGDQQGDQGTKKNDPVLPETGGSLPPGSVLNPTTPGGSSDGSGSTSDETSDPLTQLTEGLLSGGTSGDKDTSNQDPTTPTLPGVQELEDTVRDLTDPLLGGSN